MQNVNSCHAAFEVAEFPRDLYQPAVFVKLIQGSFDCICFMYTKYSCTIFVDIHEIGHLTSFNRPITGRGRWSSKAVILMIMVI